MTKRDRETDFKEMLVDDQALYAWAEVGEDVIEWLDSEPGYIEPFIKFLRRNEKIMERWRTYCSDVVNDFWYGSGE